MINRVATTSKCRQKTKELMLAEELEETPPRYGGVKVKSMCPLS
jgi:hypothetical protein